jgi:lysophospholipase L1-like esterase
MRSRRNELRRVRGKLEEIQDRGSPQTSYMSGQGPIGRWRRSIIYDKKQSNSIGDRFTGDGMAEIFRRARKPGRTWRAALLSSLALPTFSSSSAFAPFEIEVPAGGAAQVSTPMPHGEGNYVVTVGMIGPQHAVGALLSEQRRLMAEGIGFDGDKRVERRILVNVRTPTLGDLPANAPGGTSVRLKPREIGAANWDDRLNFEVTGGAKIVSLRIETKLANVLYLVGDSTVTDQPLAPNASWGQKLPRFFDDSIAVSNHAESGETLKSFVTEQRLDKLLSLLAAGDWVMIQFGHNDQKTQWPQTYVEAGTTYRSWLRTYIAEIRRRGATPILITPPERRNFDAEGRIEPTLGEYPDAMRAIANDDHVALIDLNAMSRKFYEALGPETAPRAFADEGRDKTHFNEYGAYQLARCIVEGLRTADPALTGGLALHLADDAGHFDASHPALPST